MKVYIGRYTKNDNDERKVRVRIDKWDTWSMDHTLALIIHPMLVQLKATKHGSPHVDIEDVPEELHPDPNRINLEENRWEPDDKTHDRWDWILDQIIWSFNELVLDEESKEYYTPYGPDEEVEQIWYTDEDGEKRSFDTEEAARARGKFDLDKYNAYHKKLQIGFTLFGKYYRALWD
jgi:hypothetical protein